MSEKSKIGDVFLRQQFSESVVVVGVGQSLRGKLGMLFLS